MSRSLRVRIRTWVFAILPLMLFPVGSGAAVGAEGDILIRAGTVETVEGDTFAPGAVLVSEGKIAAVGASVEAPEGAEVIDLGEGSTLLPGFVDVDLPGGVIGPSVEITREITPRFNPLPAIDWSSRSFVEALAGGTTAGALIPLSENVVPGMAPVVKTAGSGRVVEAEAALVVTIASDPASRNRSRTRPDSIYVRQPTNRMGVVAMLRDAMNRASRGADPDLDTTLPIEADPYEPLRDVIRGRRSVLTVSRTDYDILTSLRLAGEFGYVPTILGGHEAYKVAEPLAAVGSAVVLGPLRINGAYGPERTELAWNTAGVLHEAGVAVALSGGDLLEQARFAARFGLPKDEALKAITIEPAKVLGVNDRLGSIAVGKAADLVALQGDPLEFTTPVRWVMVDGVVQFPRPEPSQED
ncbi:amidohydrolase family protein [Tautonia marina]|uniref:amidohydrolase family protein n=1 Tax=Tautonia marina TaxID=2653855 RepID=UPI0013764474|nr:amidohydrolase family protein [Tautonia marina]